MPLLNTRGDVIGGGGGDPGSLNGKLYPFASNGAGCWWDDDTILFSYITAGDRLYAWYPFRDPHGTNLIPIAARGATGLWGGGGVYAALLEPVLYGTYGDIQGAGAASVALDGTLVYKTSFHALNGLTLIRNDGSGKRITDGGLASADPSWFRALPGGQAIWPHGAYGREPVRPFYADMADILLVNAAGEDWLLGWVPSRNAVVLQPDGRAEGFVFANVPMFGRALLGRCDHVLVGYAVAAGEQPGELRTFTANRSGMRYTFGTGPMVPFAALT